MSNRVLAPALIACLGFVRPANAQDLKSLPATGPTGARDIGLAANAVNLVVSSPSAKPDGTPAPEPITDSGAGSDSQKRFLFGSPENVRFDVRYRWHDWLMTYLVASNSDTAVIAFRGTDRSIVIPENATAPTGWHGKKLHELLNGVDSVTAKLYGKPYGGRGAGLENWFGGFKGEWTITGPAVDKIDEFFSGTVIHPGWAQASVQSLGEIKKLLDEHGAKSKRLIVTAIAWAAAWRAIRPISCSVKVTSPLTKRTNS